MEIVWLRLNTTNGPALFMFGNGGVVRAFPLANGSALFSHDRHVADVYESEEEIFLLIAKVRNGIITNGSKSSKKEDKVRRT